MQELLVYQAIWGLEGLEAFDLNAGMERTLDAVLAAGFDGVGVALIRKEQSETVSRVLGERGKTWEATAFVRTADDLARFSQMLLQGGSLDGANAAPFFERPAIDGGLVGSGMQTASGFEGVLKAFYATRSDHLRGQGGRILGV